MSKEATEVLQQLVNRWRELADRKKFYAAMFTDKGGATTALSHAEDSGALILQVVANQLEEAIEEHCDLR